MSKYLIFDTSAIDKPKNWKALVTDTFNWPRMIHISWIVLDENFKPLQDYNCLIKPEGYELTKEICKRCKIEFDEVQKKGHDLKDVLAQFSESVDAADYIFAHNLNYNENIVGAEMIRNRISHRLFSSERYCLMQESTYYCKIPAKGGGYKWPTILEMHSMMFNQAYSPANNARADVIAAARCFIKLMKVGAFEDLFEE